MTGSKGDKSRVIFIIVNWNRKDLTHHCLLSLEKHLSFPIRTVVVDNASNDGSPEFLRKLHQDTLVIDSSDNLGFSKACNLALKFIKKENWSSDYITFLNNDAALEDASFGSLLDYMDAHPEAAAAIPAVLRGRGIYQTGIGGYELSLRSAFNYFFFLSIVFPKSCRGFFIHQKYYVAKKQIIELDWISGVCLTLRRSTAEKIKGFPEDYFMYAEDIALCRELRAYGSIQFYPLSRIVHLPHSSSSRADPTLWLDSLFHYYRTISPRRGLRLRILRLKWIFVLGFFMRLLLNLPRYPTRKQKISELWLYCRHVLRRH